MSPNLEEALERFGLKALRPMQTPIVDAAILGEDIFAIMPTGAGKSLCYQLPAYEADGITIVISPLLALMRDQVQKMRDLSLDVFHISSSQSDDENFKNLSKMRALGRGLFYISPEQLTKGRVQIWLNQVSVSRLVIDEAHCFSEWGHDFRPDYRRLAEFLSKNPDIPVSAFTATATRAVSNDILKNIFKTRNPRIFSHAVKRENIRISFIEKNKPRQQLLAVLNDQPTIIYAATRAKTEVLAQAIRERGLLACHYHAGLAPEVRAKIEKEFLDGNPKIIVATNAFGMGVDHPNIRNIIHADMPASIESYVQEIGRAGRDGKPAQAVALYGEDDYLIRLEQIQTSITNDELRKRQITKLNSLYHLANENGGWDEIENYFTMEESNTNWSTGHDDAINQSEKQPLIALKRWRNQTARQLKLPPFWVLPDVILSQIAQAKPQTFDELARIDGVGISRLEKFGLGILNALGHDVSPVSHARRQISLSGRGALYERLKARAQELRYGQTGQEKPMECSSQLIGRIVKTNPQTIEHLGQVQGMNEDRLMRFGEAFLLELQKENR